MRTTLIAASLLLAPSMAGAQQRAFPALGAGAAWRMTLTTEDLNEGTTRTSSLEVRVVQERSELQGGRVVRLRWSGAEALESELPSELLIDANGMRIANTAAPVLPPGLAGLPAAPSGPGETRLMGTGGNGCFVYAAVAESEDMIGESGSWSFCVDASGTPQSVSFMSTAEELHAAGAVALSSGPTPPVALSSGPTPPVAEPPTAPAAPSPTSPLPTASAAGTWVGHVTAGGAQIRYQLDLRESPARISGLVIIANGVYEVEGTASAGQITLRGVRVRRASPAMCMATLQLRLDDSVRPRRLHGTWGPLGIAGGCPPPHSGRVELRAAR